MANKSSAFSVNFDAERAGGSDAVFAPPYFRFFHDYKKQWLRLAFIVLFSVLSAFVFVQIPLIISDLIDLFVASIISSFASGEPDIDSAVLTRLIVNLCLAVTAYTVITYLQNSFAASCCSSVADSLRVRSFEKTAKIRVDRFDIKSKSETFETATGKIDILNQSFSLLLTQTLPAVFMTGAILVMIFTKSIILGLVACLTVPCAVIFELIVSYFETNAALGAKTAEPVPDIGEFYRNASLLRVAGSSEYIKERFASSDGAAAAGIYNGRKFSAVRQHAAVLFSGITIALAVFLSASQLNSGSITIGVLLSVIIYLRRMETPLTQISSSKTVFRLFGGALMNIYDYFDAPDEDGGGNKPVLGETNTLSLRDISFRYMTGRTKIIEHFDADIPDSGITVVTGATAAGKTTLIKLILRLYTPESGFIALNNINIGSFDTREYRELFSVISQEAKIHGLSLQRNIAYPDSRVNEEKIREVTKFLMLDKIFENADGEIYSPGSLSSGQVQTLLIARALYHGSRFLILDESFSHVDGEYEKFLIERLKTISLTRGVIVISHRSAILSAADKIIALEGQDI